MPEYPDNFEMKPGEIATIELRYAEPKTGVVSKGRNEGNTWILYSVQVNNDGEWRGWFTSPDSTAYNAHKMIQKRNYKPGISIDIELTAEGKWIIRGETYETVFDLKPEQKEATSGPQPLDAPVPTNGPQEADPLAALEARLLTFSQAVNVRFKSIEEKQKANSDQIDLLVKHTGCLPF